MTSRTNVGDSPRYIHAPIATDTRRLALAAALLFSVAGLSGCSSRAEAADEQPAPATPIRVRTAAVIERPATVNTSGTVDANTTADVAFQVGGRVARVAVEEGQLVRAGELLAAIDPTDYSLASEQAAASAAQATDELARMRRLYEGGSLAPNDFLKFETASKVAVAQADLARERLDDTKLFSPISGIVVRRSIDRGEMAGAGAPLFSIVAVDPVTIRVGIPEAQVALIRRGAAATLTVPALPDRPFRARVAMIGVSADPASRTYPVKLDVPNPDRILLPGMIAEAQISGDRMTRALTVPGEAVVRDAEGATLVFIYLPAERRVYSRRVRVGAPIEREIEIIEGIDTGDLVVVAGQERVRDGSLVTATIDRVHADSAATLSQTPNRTESPR